MSSPRLVQPLWIRSLSAVLLVSLAFGLRLLLLGGVGPAIPYLTFYPAVMLAAVFGGIVSGSLATGLSACLAIYFFTEPVGTFSLATQRDVLGLITFIASCMLVTAAGELSIRYRMKLKEQAEKLAQINESLQLEISERSRVEQSLGSSEERFRKAIENAPFPIIIHSEDGRVISLSKAWTELTGYDRSEIKTVRDWTDRAYGEMSPAVLSKIESLYTLKGSAPVGEYVITCADGLQRIWDFSASSLGRQADGLRILMGMASDVTDRKAAEEELRTNEELLRKILSGIKAGIIIIDPQTHIILDVNTVAESIIGISKEELVGKSCMSIKWKNTSGSAAYSCPLNEKNVNNEEYLIERSDGKVLPIVKTVISAVHKQKLLFYEIIFDFSERKALERQLALAQRLESIGGLAAGIAHEINTPIQYVGDNLSFLEGAFVDLADMFKSCGESALSSSQHLNLDFLFEEVPKALAQSREGVARVAEIVRAMKRFSHMGGEEKALLDVQKAIDNTVMISRNEWKYHADIQLDLDPAAQYLLCHPGDFNQVVLNLLVNAGHALTEKYKDLDEKGTITVKTRKVGDWLELSVSDTGCGIPEKNLGRIFDPFFTTKEVGKGTGQGLAICHDVVVKKHGGTIDVHSELGQGTTFVLRFPLLAQGLEHP